VWLDVLAQDTDPAEDEGGLLDGLPDAGEQMESLQEVIEGLLPSPLDAFVAPIISPGLSILLILVLATVLSRFSKRAISRTVRRMKEPEGSRTARLRRSLSGGDPAVDDLRRNQRADALGSVARSVSGVVIWTIAVIMILGTIGVQVAPLIAGAGVVGVALGFGAQDLVKDFLSGVFMLIEDQYGVGDIIDAGEAAGVVEGITLRSTRIRSVDGTLWHIPNGEIRRVGNMSQEFAMALLDIGVSYGTDVDVASDIIERVAVDMAGEEQYADIFLDTPEILGVENLGDDAVDIRLRIKTKPAQQWAVARELRRRIKKAFDVSEIEIPFPQRTVWLRTEQPVALGAADAPTFATPVPDEATIVRAVEESRRGDTGAPDELADLLPDAPLDAEPAADDED
jgi:moderate conductance mechanosensitive channel